MMLLQLQTENEQQMDRKLTICTQTPHLVHLSRFVLDRGRNKKIVFVKKYAAAHFHLRPAVISHTQTGAFLFNEIFSF